jgi:hypothetical protein
MADEQELGAALSDVRKAYRLLWCYQKRIFDIIRLIVDEFDDMSFYYWQTLHSGRPCNSGTDPLKRWTWDMLPMMKASYLYLPSDVDRNSTKPGQWMLEILVESDSGFDCPEDGTEPDPANFKEAAESTSSISIYAWYCTGVANVNWFNGVWKQISWPEIDGEPFENADPPFLIVKKTLNITSLFDKGAVQAAASEFKEMASKALGVTLA